MDVKVCEVRRSAALLSWLGSVGTCLLALASACVGALEPPPGRSAEDFGASEGRALVDLAELAALREAADAAPDELELQWRAGMAHVRASLRGQVDLRDHAERYLERAWRLDPEARDVPAAKILARFLNMRSSVLDLDKLDLQIELYRSLLDEDELARGPLEMTAGQFHFVSFVEAAEALRRYADGEVLGALRQLNTLERTMQARTAHHPEEIDTCAMAGNFELTFAGVVPVGINRRLARGVAYLETQQDHWDQLSPAARSVGIAPNVRSVFALFLAEGLLAAGQREEAAARYRQIQALEDQPDTRPRAQILSLVEHRLAHLDDYAGDLELLPPWPSGVTGCVACHAREAELPTDDLHLLPGLPGLEGP